MMSKLKLFFATVLAFLLSLSLQAQADTLDDIVKRGSLKVGVSLFEPWTMDSGTGEYYGFEVDVANKLAQDMGVKAELKAYEWDHIISALNKGEIDVIAGGMAITPARALILNFSLPYADSGIVMVANSELTKQITSMEHANQKDVVFAVVAETTSNELAGSLFDNATIKPYKTAQEAAEAVISGAAHVYIGSSPQPEFLALEHPDVLDLPLDKPLLTYKAGLAIKKGQPEWLNFLNAWVTAKSADKWLSATHDYWFENLDWRQGTN